MSRGFISSKRKLLIATAPPTEMMVLTANSTECHYHTLEASVFLDFFTGHCSTITSLGRVDNDKSKKTEKGERSSHSLAAGWTPVPGR